MKKPRESEARKFWVSGGLAKGMIVRSVALGTIVYSDFSSS
jgi:hypothetical protein